MWTHQWDHYSTSGTVSVPEIFFFNPLAVSKQWKPSLVCVEPFFFPSGLFQNTGMFCSEASEIFVDYFPQIPAGLSGAAADSTDLTRLSLSEAYQKQHLVFFFVFFFQNKPSPAGLTVWNKTKVFVFCLCFSAGVLSSEEVKTGIRSSVWLNQVFGITVLAIPPNSTLSTESDPRSHKGDSQPIRRVLQQGYPHAEQDPKPEHWEPRLALMSSWFLFLFTEAAFTNGISERPLSYSWWFSG